MPVAVVTRADTLVGAAVTARLKSDDWAVLTDSIAGLPGDTEIAALVYDPGLLDGGTAARAWQVVDQFLDAAERLGPRLRPRAHGGARIVVVSSRDSLGWPGRPHAAAAAAALIAAARSLALQLGPAGVTVNTVAALPPEASPLRAASPPAGTHLREPSELTPYPVTADDVAAAVTFLLHPRSGYLTGQVLHCCGGASLLSSLSA
jgi:hypothetical protein